MLRDQNDIKHILDDLADITKKGESVRQLAETDTHIDPDVEFHIETVKTENELKESSDVSNVMKMKVSRLNQDIEDKSIQLKNALENLNKLLEMKVEDKESLEEKEKIHEELTSRLTSIEDGHNDKDNRQSKKKSP